MTYTTLAQLKSLKDNDIIEAVPAIIDFVKDPETKVSKSSGKPYESQSLKLKGSDGTECWVEIYEKSLFMDRSSKGRKAIFCSTVRDGKMQGIVASIWGDKASFRVLSGANITFPEAAQAAPQPAAQTQQQPAQQKSAVAPQADAKPEQSLSRFVDMWLEIYNRIQPVVQNDTATAATTTIFIEANKHNIGPTLTSPKAALASFESQANKIAAAIIEKGCYDADKLPDGTELDEVVDILIDKAAESISREKIGVAFDAFVSGYPKGREAAVKAMLSDWDVFLGGVK